MTFSDKSDDFWSIAFHDGNEIHNHHDRSNVDSEAVHDATDVISTMDNGLKLYQIEIPPFGFIDLNLMSLSMNANEENSLGAQAWYGSALLAATMQQINHGNESIIKSHIDRCFEGGGLIFKILELGSGAVGLAGIVAGLSVEGYIQLQQNEHLECNVILSDCDTGVLQQLEYNVSTCSTKMESAHPNINVPNFSVLKLDWESTDDMNNLYSENTGDKTFHLVIGSELVYSMATATACTKIVLNLLNRNPNMLLVLIQVADREGWDTVFVPKIYQSPNTHIYIESPIRSNAAMIHHVASKLVAPGGTLNPLLDFSVCYIWR
jgi:hypothetical protein